MAGSYHAGASLSTYTLRPVSEGCRGRVPGRYLRGIRLGAGLGGVYLSPDSGRGILHPSPDTDMGYVSDVERVGYGVYRSCSSFVVVRCSSLLFVRCSSSFVRRWCAGLGAGGRAASDSLGVDIYPPPISDTYTYRVSLPRPPPRRTHSLLCASRTHA